MISVKHTAFLNCPTDFIQLMNKMENVRVLKYSEIGEKIFLTDKTMVEIDNPAMMPSPQVINYIEEPYVKASIMTPNEYIGSIMELCQSKRGEYVDIEIEDDITVEEFLKRINEELPKGVEFIKAKEISCQFCVLYIDILAKK